MSNKWHKRVTKKSQIKTLNNYYVKFKANGKILWGDNNSIFYICIN